jgi:fidgetin-like protein 1
MNSSTQITFQTVCSDLARRRVSENGSRSMRMRYPDEFTSLHIGALQALISARSLASASAASAAAAAAASSAAFLDEATTKLSRKRPLDTISLEIGTEKRKAAKIESKDISTQTIEAFVVPAIPKPSVVSITPIPSSVSVLPTSSKVNEFKSARTGLPPPAISNVNGTSGSGSTVSDSKTASITLAAAQAAAAAAVQAASSTLSSSSGSTMTRKMGAGLPRPVHSTSASSTGGGFRLPRKVGDPQLPGPTTGSSSSSSSSSSAILSAQSSSSSSSALSSVPNGPNGLPSILQMYGKDAVFPKPLPDHMAGVDLNIADELSKSLVYTGDAVSFADIAGLDAVKRLLYQAVVYPMEASHLLRGSKLLEMPKGILLFGPPGTGKTLLAKAAASTLKATFFCASASSIGSKWYGESEKMVKALFAAAIEYEPCILFIDEVDSLLTARKDNEDPASGKIKTQFLIEMDGANRKSECKVLVMAATNRPDMLDEAVRRRFSRRILIPLPDYVSRLGLINRCLDSHGGPVDVPQAAREELAAATESYSSADVEKLCQTAGSRAFGRWIRKTASGGRSAQMDVDGAQQNTQDAELHVLQSAQSIKNIDPILAKDLRAALREQRPSVSAADVSRHEKFNEEFGFKATIADDDDDDDDDDE